MSSFRLLLVGVSLVVLVSFFLPWARPLPSSQVKTAAKEKIAAGEPSFVWDFLLMSERDRKEFFLSEPEGVSAYQMILADNKESRIGKLTQTITQHLWNADSPDWRIKMLVLFPLLTIVSLFCFLREDVPVIVSMGLTFLLVLLYAAARWQMNLGYLLHIEMALAPGLWLTLYGSLVLALGNLGMCIKK